MANTSTRNVGRKATVTRNAVKPVLKTAAKKTASKKVAAKKPIKTVAKKSSKK